jgi:hypothetical protein
MPSGFCYIESFSSFTLSTFEGLFQVLIHTLTPCALTAHSNTTIVFV